MGEAELHGGCLCGTVRFTISTPPTDAAYCHCTRCQRRTGTASSASARIDGRSLRFTSGAQAVRGWRHPDGGMEKCFCSVCGAHLFARDPDDPSRMGVRMSAFDSDPGVRPSAHQFVDDAADWEPIPDDGLPRYPGPRPS